MIDRTGVGVRFLVLFLHTIVVGIAGDRTTIACKVNNALQHEPVADAQVTLTDSEGHEVTGTTGSNGAALLHVSGPGPFVLTGTHDNFVPARYDSYYPFDGAQVVRMVNDQSFTACELQLKPRSRIEGRVTDADRNPVTNATVTALWRTFQNPSAQTYMYAAVTHSAPDGSFVLSRLLPGVYVLRADPPDASAE